ncbi:hypothetical protein DUNSADRAFT_10042 [Dunaliella salina]|uniref:Encoded protein n=1 Tax=Dunaliella salina TaxID=3046 RepID=A0ABQ7GG59_DUNSA|nr:hypothetical protein DUNSADRAFT_10042 [Dunaliella salina]|eukprot:KAF5833590.1 hypothetical protein DUNSADRAFT_10042 [Dunaliella salina]
MALSQRATGHQMPHSMSHLSRAALAAVVYGKNGVDNEGRSQVENLSATLHQAAYVSYAILDMLRQRGSKNEYQGWKGAQSSRRSQSTRLKNGWARNLMSHQVYHSRMLTRRSRRKRRRRRSRKRRRKRGCRVCLRKNDSLIGYVLGCVHAFR